MRESGLRRFGAVAAVAFGMLWCAPLLGKVERFEARDTLDVASIPAASEDEAAAVAGIEWEPAAFDVTAMTAPADMCDAFVFFPSPRPGGDKVIDRVAMEWYAARSRSGEPRRARAVLLVHTLHPAMPFERALARRLAGGGTHVFLVHMPGYGMRVSGGGELPGVVALTHNVQAVADVRRAHDAIRALPNIGDDPIGLVGVSLGGFAAATAASLDRAFEPVALFISGGDGYRVLRQGAADARWLGEAMEAAGYRGERLRSLLLAAEPLRVARRLDENRTWLTVATHDQVIPAWSSDALVKRAGLSRAEGHYVAWSADHYTFALWIGSVAEQVERLLRLTRGGD